MSISGNNILAGASGSQEYKIDRSLRFNDDDSAYLNFTPGSAGNRKTWTWSGWVKRGVVATANMNLFAVRTAASNRTLIRIRSHALDILDNDTSFQLTTTAVFRDPSAWYHFVIVLNTTESTSSDRLKIYVNGDQVTDFSTSTYPSSNYEAAINQTNLHALGREGGSDNDYFDGYMAEVNFVDGTALAPSSFGETDPVTGAWIPKQYSGSYGSQGWYLKFADNSGVTATTLGKDSSGNGNNWTPNNFSVTAGTGNDSLKDTPTNNWCTFNPLHKGTITVSEGNLKAAGGADYQAIHGTIGLPSTGKFYWEATVNSTSGAVTDQFVGVAGNDTALSGTSPYPQSDTPALYYVGTGSLMKNGTTNVQTGLGAFSADDVIGVAYDADASTVQFYKNGSAVGTAESLPSTTETLFPAYIATTNRFANFNWGQRSFDQTLPTGFKALNTANLPVPTVKDGTEYFNTVLWSGDGNTPRSITGVGFQPDFIWTKPRSTADDHLLMDVIRGTGNLKWLATNSTSAEGIAYNNANVTSLDSDGFTVGTTGGTNQLNATSRAPVAWNWKAGGSGSANTDGTISSTVSVSADSGISIVSYTGSGANATIGHNLGVAPSMVIVKNRDAATDWSVWAEPVVDQYGAAYAVFLQATSGAGSYSGVFNSTAPTSTVFSVGTSSSTNTSSQDYIALVFSEVEGYSKIGKYTGNGSTDGTFVYTGFRPAFVMTKRIDSTGSWYMFDNTRAPFNEAEPYLLANATNVEATDLGWDLLSNGFKHRTSYIEQNTSGGIYMYMAFAETPFKYVTAR